jgi:hypothetical protein
MDKAIFNLGLSTEATSLYILIEALVSEGKEVSFPACEARWTSDCAEMATAMAELEARGVVDVTDGKIEIKDSHAWRPLEGNEGGNG